MSKSTSSASILYGSKSGSRVVLILRLWLSEVASRSISQTTTICIDVLSAIRDYGCTIAILVHVSGDVRLSYEAALSHRRSVDNQ